MSGALQSFDDPGQAHQRRGSPRYRFEAHEPQSWVIVDTVRKIHYLRTKVRPRAMDNWRQPWDLQLLRNSAR